jgi:hypothetical protein
VSYAYAVALQVKFGVQHSALAVKNAPIPSTTRILPQVIRVSPNMLTTKGISPQRMDARSQGRGGQLSGELCGLPPGQTWRLIQHIDVCHGTLVVALLCARRCSKP